MLYIYNVLYVVISSFISINYLLSVDKSQKKKYEQATVRTRRAQDCFLLAIPPISKTCAASFFEQSFIYAAPTLWNKLSIDIRMLEFIQS